MEVDRKMILKDFVNQLQNLDEGSISLDELLENERDKAIYEKWIEIFNIMNPMDVLQGLNTVNSVFKMSKRDEIILIAYVKFFEQKISMLGNLPKNLSEVFGKEMPKKEKKNGYQGAEFG